MVASAALLFTGCSTQEKKPADYVDPFIGTAFHGHTYPGATAPFGAVQLSPDNYRGVWDACSGYHYDQPEIIGFSHTHLSGTGCADLADVLFHPTTHDVDLSREGDIFEFLPYSHKDEEAVPGYYSVFFRKEGVKAELTLKEYELLTYLMQNRNIALSRDRLLQDIWGYDFFGDDRTIDTHIKNLRSRIGDYRDKITTVRGVGYKFEDQ